MSAVLKASGPSYNRMFVLATEQNLLNDFALSERVKSYRSMLVNADWFYRYADRHEDFMAGQREFNKILDLQAEVDPDGAIWREVAPKSHSSGLDLPQPRVKAVQS